MNDFNIFTKQACPCQECFMETAHVVMLEMVSCNIIKYNDGAISLTKKFVNNLPTKDVDKIEEEDLWAGIMKTAKLYDTDVIHDYTLILTSHLHGVRILKERFQHGYLPDDETEKIKKHLRELGGDV